jgi:hypothetical protein
LENLCLESLNLLEQILLEVQLHWDFKSKDLDALKENAISLRKIATEKVTECDKEIEESKQKLQNIKLTLTPVETKHQLQLIKNAQQTRKVCFGRNFDFEK